MNSMFRFGMLLITLLPGITYAGEDYPDHRGSSEWGFDVIAKPSDVYVVNDADGGTIDRYMFRQDGEIVINVPIRRYVGPTDGSGNLQNISTLISQGVVSETFNIYMPAYDVDEGVFPIADCDGDNIADQLYDEVNEVYFNDEKLGKFRGANQRWFQQAFTISTSKLKFPSAPGGVANNEIRVKIDVDNATVVLSSGQVGCTVWATEVDWVGIQFKAAAPIVLVHGIRSSGSTLVNLKDGFNALNLLADNSIKFNEPAEPAEIPFTCGAEAYNQSIAFNVAQLKTEIPRIVKEFGASSVNLVTHSKGGIDSLGYLSATRGENAIKVQVGTMSGQPVMHELKANSLVTLNTPHKGSVLAKYAVEARQVGWATVTNSPNKFLLAGVKGLDGSYMCDITPARANAFVSTALLPNGIDTASVATSADNNNSGSIDTSAEAAGFGAIPFANLSYLTVGIVNDVSIEVIPSGNWYTRDTVTITPSVNTTFFDNDIIVTRESASRYTTYTGVNHLNHLNVHSLATAETIGKDAQSKSGLVDWRVK